MRNILNWCALVLLFPFALGCAAAPILLVVTYVQPVTGPLAVTAVLAGYPAGIIGVLSYVYVMSVLCEENRK